MAKLTTTKDINIRNSESVIFIPEGSYINVTEEMAIYLTDEDILEDETTSRVKKAVRSNNLLMTYVDYTYL